MVKGKLSETNKHKDNIFLKSRELLHKMKLPNFDYHKIIHHLTISINILFVLFLLANYLGGISEAWTGFTSYFFYFAVLINTLFFALKIKKIPESVRDKSSMIYYFSHFFLLTLVIIVVNQFLKNEFVSGLLTEISVVSIALGFLTFYAHRNKVEREIEEEKVSEEKAEKKRFLEFGERFPRLKFFDINYGIKENWEKRNFFRLIFMILICPFVFLGRLPFLVGRWMYKEGWWYSVGLVAIVVLFLGLRLYSMDYIDGSDNYNDVAVKALYENGHSFYEYSIITTQLMLLSVKTFGFEIWALKLPFILYSLITVIFIYFIAKFIDKRVALLSIFLFAISPWSIILSKVTRDYSFDCMIGAIVLYLGFCLYRKTEKIDIKKKFSNFFSLFILVLLIISIYMLTKFNGRSQTLLVLIFLSVIGIFIIYNFLRGYLKRNSKFTQCLKGLYFPIILIILGFYFYFLEYWPFMSGFLFDRFYFDVFFNSLAESPWQWFHEKILSFVFIFAFFLIPLIFLNKKNIQKIVLTYSLFFIPLCFYLFKYQTHLNYNPTRYIYFLFPVYCILLSLSIFYFIKNCKRVNIQKLFLILIFILLFFNFTSLHYATDPVKAYEREGISILNVDNIGIGRFEMEEVVNFIKEDLNWSQEDPYVFGGRYGEFILLLNYSINNDRFLLRDNNLGYDIGKNMFVESSYFNYHELEKAIIYNDKGYFITRDSYMTNFKNFKILKFYNNNFIVHGKEFIHLKTINNFKIYEW